jgi:methyl-accepting chemotaxis protein
MDRNTVRLGLFLVAVVLVSAGFAAAARIGGLSQAYPMLMAALVGLGGALLTLGFLRRTTAGHRQFAAAVGSQTDHMMIGAAETAFFIESVKKKVEQDVASTEAIVRGTEQNADTMEQIAHDAEQASKVAADVRNVSVAGRAEVDRGLARINRAREQVDAAATMMNELKARSRQIHGITETINEIAARTNLLALNAAIEAARAGEYGRGFAVVANEVRMLAQRTRDATDEIGTMVRAMNDKADAASSGMDAVSTSVTQASQNVQEMHAVLGRIEVSATTSEQEILAIAAASRENVDTTRRIAQSVLKIRDGMLVTEEALPRAGASAMQLSEHAESLFKATVSSGVPTPHDEIRAIATEASTVIGKLFSEAVASGQITIEALFDRRYQPIPDTDPPKHTSQFDGFTDHVLPTVQEAILATAPHLAYAGAVDDKGYFPTHNRKFSQPLTGNYDVDLANNRTKRIFSDRTGSRCGANTEPFLLQTYKRDTGEVMHDLSVPIYVGQRHWGGFRIGYRSAAK